MLDTAELLQHIAFRLPGHIYWKDANFRYQWCNQEHLRSLGFTDISEIAGKTDFDLVWKDQAGKLRSVDQRVVKTGKTYKVREKVKLADKKTHTFLSKKMLLTDKEKIVGILGVSIDISTLRRLPIRQQAEKGDYEKVTFIQNIRHAIRAPIIEIIQLVELIQQENNIASYVDRLSASSQSILAYLNKILYSLELSPKVMGTALKFDLKALLQSVVDLNAGSAARKQLEFMCHVDEETPICLIGDAAKIHAILLELVTNAIKFTHKGKVSIQANIEKTGPNYLLKLIVIDTGIGIKKSKQKEIFTYFSRLNLFVEKSYPGIGLGLYRTHTLIQSLEGELSVKSVLGEGSVFTCYIPIKKPIKSNDRSDVFTAPDYATQIVV